MKMNMNIPNFFSVLRIVSIPFFIILLSYDYHLAAFTIFVLAAITDACDGFFARLLNQKTVLGAYLDPIADKLLLVSSFIALVLIGLIPLWLAVLVVSRDVLISIGILILRLTAYQIELKPSILSKCTTFLQILTIGMTLLLHILEKSSAVIGPLYWITGILTIVSGIHYISRGMKITTTNNIKEGY